MSARHCGDCQLCCRLLPIPSFNKPAGKRCQHQRHKVGCAIYATRPEDCQVWSCRWLADPAATPGLARPDHGHYVVDIMPDFITLQDNETGQVVDIEAIQVWIDPAFPDAHKAPALRAYLEREAERNQCAALIRFDHVRGFVLFAPPISSDHQWHEMQSSKTEEQTPERMSRLLGYGMSVVVKS